MSFGRFCLAIGSILLVVPAWSAPLPLTVSKWYQDRCPSEPPPAPQPGVQAIAPLAAIAAIVLPKLLDAGVDHVSAAIKAAADTESKVTEASPLLGKFYTVNETGDFAVSNNVKCLVVVRATYKDAQDGGLRDGDILAGIDKFVFRMEAKVERIPGLKYFRLVPRYLETGTFDLGSFWNSERDLSVSVSMKSLGSTEPFASWTFQWQRMIENQRFESTDLRLGTAASGPLPYPADAGDANVAKARQGAKVAPYIVAIDVLDSSVAPASPSPRPDDLKDDAAKNALIMYCAQLDAANKATPQKSRTVDRRCFVALNDAEKALEAAISRAYFRKESVDWAKGFCPEYDPVDQNSRCALPWADGIQGGEFGAFVASVALTESRPANKFGVALAAAISNSTDDIKKTLREKLIPSERRKAEDTSDQESRSERRDILLADMDVAAAEATLSAAQAVDLQNRQDIIKAQIDLAKKKIAANNAYRKAGRVPPYPEYD